MPPADVPVVWEASSTDDFATIVASDQQIAKAETGHSVHAIAQLAQGSWFYRFRAGQYVSPTGITRVAPTTVTAVKFAAGSCKNYQDGYYAAHRDIAERAPTSCFGSATTSTRARALPMPIRRLASISVQNR